MTADNTPVPDEVVRRYLTRGHEPNDRDFRSLLAAITDALEAIAAGNAPDKAVMKAAPAELNERLKLKPRTAWLETIAATVDRYSKGTQLLAEVRSVQQRAEQRRAA